MEYEAFMYFEFNQQWLFMKKRKSDARLQGPVRKRNWWIPMPGLSLREMQSHQHVDENVIPKGNAMCKYTN